MLVRTAEDLLLVEGKHREQLEKLQAEKMKTLTSVLAGVAHELNNPAQFLTQRVIWSC